MNREVSQYAIEAGFATRRVRMLAGASFLLVGFAIGNWPTQAAAQSMLDSSGTRAVPTYESVGLYWSSPGANATTGCEVKFRQVGDSAWRQGLAMWFDARDNECRGSLVNLAPATHYEVQMNLPGVAPTRGLAFTTWSNSLPVARTITVNSSQATLDITAGGSAAGYVVYQGAPGATLDAVNASQFNVSVNASYVIVRGLTLKGAQQDAIRIAPTLHDVVIEDNDISGWGRTRDGTWGVDMDSGVRAICRNEELTRVTVQRNRIHDPRYSANSWTNGHPAGPQGVTFSYCGGNHVIRHNEIAGGARHFNDAVGGEDNFSKTGFPNADSDIYGNRISGTWDDGIEAEGGNRNVRIWGNFLDRTATGIATTVVSVGPVYIFRNVYSRNQFYEGKPHDQDDRQPFFKSGSDASLGDGRRYLIHNTMLQATEAGSAYGLGGGAGVTGTGSAQLVNNTVSMNNIYHLWKPNSAVDQAGVDNLFQNDMFNGNAGVAMVGGINATPTYAAGNGWQSESGGQYALAAGTPGFDQGMRIANFNDDFLGAAPDVGAAEAGAPAMKFAIAASAGSSLSGTPVVTPAPAPTPAPDPTSGSTTPSSGLDSSQYSSNAGQSVTFTATLLGNAGTPTGTVAFRDNGVAIASCAAVALADGKASCTTANLSSGTHPITGMYSGNATYSSSIAGPINQAVTGGSVATKLSIDSSRYSSPFGQGVTFTVTVTGNGAPTGTVDFTDNGASIAGCASVALANGVATCATSALERGNHAIKGLYSGSAGPGAAGPITEAIS